MDDSASLKKNHGIIPAINHNTNGLSPTSPLLNPTWNTNQYTAIVTRGWINPHITPRYDDAYLVLKSFIERLFIKPKFLNDTNTNFTLFFNPTKDLENIYPKNNDPIILK